MYKCRLSAKLKAHRPKPSANNQRYRPPIRGISETLPDEVSVDWLYNELRTAIPRDSNGSYGFKWEYLCSELLSKLPTDEVPSEVRRQAALDKMFESEDRCRAINQDGFVTGFGYTAERLNTVLRIAKAKSRLYWANWTTQYLSSHVLVQALRLHGRSEMVIRISSMTR